MEVLPRLRNGLGKANKGTPFVMELVKDSLPANRSADQCLAE